MVERTREIELRHIRYFVAATKYGSLRGAAKALGVQESTVSRAIRDLEDSLGASLLQRHVSGVSQTVAGSHFLVRAIMILQQLTDSVEDVATIGRGKSGHIKIGIFSSAASGFLSDLLREFGAKHENVRIDLIDATAADHLLAVQQLRLDVAFITSEHQWSGCEKELLWTEKIFVVLPLGHFLTELHEISWLDFKDDVFIVNDTGPGPEIRKYIAQRLVHFGRNPNIRLQQVGRDNLFALVSVGCGLTLTSEATTVAQIPGVVFRPIVDESLTFGAVWSPRNDNPALRRLLSMARNMSNIGAS